MARKAPTSQIALLRARIDRIERRSPFGRACPTLEAETPWRNLAPGALYELVGGDWRDGPAVEGYALALASGLMGERRGEAFIIRLRRSQRDEGRCYAPDRALYGLQTARLTLCFAKDMKALLWAAEEAVRGGAVAVIVEAGRPHKLLDLTATRRLQLAADASGATPILLRHPDDRETTSAAMRLRVSAAPSAGALFDSQAPGAARWRVEIERCRLGKRGAWVVEWDDERRELREAPPLSLPLSAALADRPVAAIEAVA